MKNHIFILRLGTLYFLSIGILFFAGSCNNPTKSGSYVDSNQLTTTGIIIDVDTMAVKMDSCPPICLHSIIIDVDTMIAANITMYSKSKSSKIKESKGNGKKVSFYQLPVFNGHDTTYVLLPKNQFDALTHKTK